MVNVDWGPNSCPVGEFTFQFWSAVSTSFSPMPCAFSLFGSSCTRTAYFCAPFTVTCETPLTIEMLGAIMFSAKSSTADISIEFDVRLRKRIGWSAGFCLRNDGGDVSVDGRSGMAAAIAVCTSTAALSMLRSRSNVIVMFVLPLLLDDVISSMPAIVVNWRSSGLATVEAIVFGSPPGKFAPTWIVGKSTVGRSLTGSARYATMPNSAIPAISKLVAIGRRMKISEMFTRTSAPCPRCVLPTVVPRAGRRCGRPGRRRLAAAPAAVRAPRRRRRPRCRSDRCAAPSCRSRAGAVLR